MHACDVRVSGASSLFCFFLLCFFLSCLFFLLSVAERGFAAVCLFFHSRGCLNSKTIPSSHATSACSPPPPFFFFFFAALCYQLARTLGEHVLPVRCPARCLTHCRARCHGHCPPIGRNASTGIFPHGHLGLLSSNTRTIFFSCACTAPPAVDGTTRQWHSW